jgi:uncharacterized protein YyaL (SSP411 family)
MLAALVLSAALTSPYIASHATDAVRWQPWGDAAIARAKREQKPLFLSIGYASCHWCHVMQRESFADAAVARLLNERFVPVLVDREEHPDVDAAFLAYVELMNDGAAGWPANVITTAELEPLAGAAYLPRDALVNLLTIAAAKWTTDRAALRTEAAEVIAAARELAQLPPPATSLTAALQSALDEAHRAYDAANGGFGSAPKFPQPMLIDLLLRESLRTGDAAPRELAAAALRAMANGAIHDQLGGGFHRYATDAAWRKPHFEKMLTDQALLAIDCTEAFQLTRDRAFAEIARSTLDAALRDFRDAPGGFVSSLDSDTAAGEGAYYAWTPDEVTQLLGPRFAAVAMQRFGITATNGIPFIAATLAETGAAVHMTREQAADVAAGVAAKLLEARAKRPLPQRDEKVLTGWNGLMIAALARAGAALDEPRYIAAATEAARFLETKRWTSKSLTRVGDVAALTEDYAFTIGGLLDLYESSGDVHWLRLATALQSRQDALFWREPLGRYASGSKLPEPVAAAIDEGDGALPSFQSASAMNLLRLADLTDDERARARATRIITSFSARIATARTPALAAALSRSLAPPQQIMLAGDRRDAATRALLRVVQSRWLPNRTLLFADAQLPVPSPPKPPRPRAVAYLCEHYVCKLPIEDPSTLARALDSSTSGPSPR